MARLEGAATIVGLADGRLFAFRDRHGFRPLVLGRLGGDPVVASETCALDLIGAAFEREIRPGELFLAGPDGEPDDPGARARPSAGRSASSSSSPSRSNLLVFLLTYSFSYVCSGLLTVLS